MSKELKRMQELAGVPVNEEKENLNEHQIGGVVGIGAIHTPKREKSDYEMAFEHFMNEGKEEEVEEGYDEMGRMVQDVDTTREYLIKQMKNKRIVNDEDKKEFLERFLKFQTPVGYDGKKRMADRIEAAQSLLNALPAIEESYEEDDTMEEAVGIAATPEAIRGEIQKLIKKFEFDEDLGAAVRSKFSSK